MEQMHFFTSNTQNLRVDINRFTGHHLVNMADMRFNGKKATSRRDISVINTRLPHNFISGVRETFKITMFGHMPIIIDPTLGHSMGIASDQVSWRRQCRMSGGL